MNVFGGLLSTLGLVLGQIVAYHIVMATVPSYIGLWVAAIVLMWVGIIITTLAK